MAGSDSDNDLDRLVLRPMRMDRRAWLPLAAATLLLVACERESPSRPGFDVFDVNVRDLQAALTDGRVTSRELVERYVARIQHYDGQVKAIIAVNPHARDDADRLDRERAQGQVRGPLHGIPIVVKDNIDVAGGMATT